MFYYLSLNVKNYIIIKIILFSNVRERSLASLSLTTLYPLVSHFGLRLKLSRARAREVVHTHTLLINCPFYRTPLHREW